MWRRVAMGMVVLLLGIHSLPALAGTRDSAEELCRKFAKMDQVPPDQINAYMVGCVRDMWEMEGETPAEEPSPLDLGVGGVVAFPPLRLPGDLGE